MLLGAACSVPLAPGYRIVNQSREVKFIPGVTPGLRVESQYALQNSGTTDLSFIDVNLPEARFYGTNDVNATIDGRMVSLVPLPEEYQPSSPNARRIEFDPVWKRRERRDLAISYVFVSPADSGSRITAGAEDFHLSSRGWSPMPQAPRHFLSPYPIRPNHVGYTVRVPSDFMVLGRGKLSGQKQAGEETVYRFELRKDDLTPFVVAGKYVTTASGHEAAEPVFWTFQPLNDDPQPALTKIAAAWDLLTKDFGQLDRNIRAPHIVESSGLRDRSTADEDSAAVAFPGGALVGSATFALGIESDAFLAAATHALAHNWFGDQVFFTPDAALGMGEGLPAYATIVIDESEKGETGRRQRIIEYLNRYDKLRTQEKETPLGVTMRTDPPAQQRIALSKAPLFYIALEDVCGEAPVRGGLKQMVTLLRGQQTSYDALRSTLEQFCGKDLAPIFRVWLNDSGVPADFRSRYGGAQANAGAQP